MTPLVEAPSAEALPRKSRLGVLLDHFAEVEDPRDVRRILHPLSEVLLLVVCGTIADCDDYEDIAGWGAAHLGFLRRHLPYEHGVPGERWLTILMDRINPALFAAAFAGWVRESWPQKASLVAIDGKTSRRSHDRAAGAGPLHLVSAFATTARLVLAAEAVPDKGSELAAIPVLLERLGAEEGLKGALLSIDAIATNEDIAEAIIAQGADYLLAVKANQPTLRAEVEAAFAAAPPGTLDTHACLDKGHGPHRAAPHGRPSRDRLARRLPPLPGRASPARGRLPRPHRDPRRAQGRDPHRDPLLHRFPPPLRAGSRHRCPPALGDREPPALGARRHLRGRPVPPPQRPRRPQRPPSATSWRNGGRLCRRGGRRGISANHDQDREDRAMAGHAVSSLARGRDAPGDDHRPRRRRAP
jgi:DDE_Tnp_1-associated/Transposase DDE domain